MPGRLRYYELPLSKRQLESVSSGLRPLVGGSAAEISKRLRAGWRHLKAEPVAKLARLLATATPTRVATLDKEAWLLLTHSRAPKVARGVDASQFEPERFVFWLPPPLPAERVTAAFQAVDIAPSAAMVEFFSTFGGLRDVEPSRDGSFELPSRRLFPTREDSAFETHEPAAKWKGSAVIYRACNGDRVLIGRSGRTAWASLSRAEVVPAAPTFAALLQGYRRLADHCTAFDSFANRRHAPLPYD